MRTWSTIYKKYYTEMMKEWDFLTATGKIMESQVGKTNLVFCIDLNVSNFFLKSTKMVLARKECGTLITQNPLWSRVRLS